MSHKISISAVLCDVTVYFHILVSASASAESDIFTNLVVLYLLVGQTATTHSASYQLEKTYN